MDDHATDARRIQPSDALAYLLADLQVAAPEAARRAAGFVEWFKSSVDLLACVPDVDQRMSWAYALVAALPSASGANPTEMICELLRLAREVRACRTC